ncbi:carboxymuconolactone decarboxylase family protein [Paenibacillus dendritiformis]|uniref:Alkylhydroperoxidase-like protein n=1 Tax=Paenibacillus dendritiformis C454 TaxID=1131935 RepID=H3SH22_9BACL|nr:carboxymuconolactone decarboxylase family protein [Paenibacillus dendritiformis]EHQ61640.1 alkylhydroperoxidase-like protein [Paenibacillus dendritiformis C454]CAH8770337.1 carboxymuconolactone decarboxylase family protein [Paenibacillus dendritiformis]
MEFRMVLDEVNPAAYEAMMGLESFVMTCGLDPSIIELIKLRVSQMNRSSVCMNINGRTLYDKGDNFERIVLLDVWRDVPNYSSQEKAALELAEHITRVAELGVPDYVYEQVRAHFTEQQYVNLVMAINAINCWNRLEIAAGMTPGCAMEK